MTIQHKDLPEAQLHEPKGATSALERQVYHSDGVGSGAWQYINVPIVSTSALVARSFSNQAPTALDVPIQVEFGSAQTNTDVSIDANGTVTFLTAGSYLFTFFGRVARTTATGSAYLGIRYLINGTQQGATSMERLPDATATRQFTITLSVNVQANDTLSVEFYRDSAGINNGTLSTFSTTPAGWEDAPSASLFIYKLQADDS